MAVGICLYLNIARSWRIEFCLPLTMISRRRYGSVKAGNQALVKYSLPAVVMLLFSL